MLSPTNYYQSKAAKRSPDHERTTKVIAIFKASRNNYGSRKIKVELKKLGLIVSRRRIMNKGLCREEGQEICKEITGRKGFGWKEWDSKIVYEGWQLYNDYQIRYCI